MQKTLGLFIDNPKILLSSEEEDAQGEAQTFQQSSPYTTEGDINQKKKRSQQTDETQDTEKREPSSEDSSSDKEIDSGNRWRMRENYKFGKKSEELTKSDGSQLEEQETNEDGDNLPPTIPISDVYYTDFNKSTCKNTGLDSISFNTSTNIFSRVHELDFTVKKQEEPRTISGSFNNKDTDKG